MGGGLGLYPRLSDRVFVWIVVGACLGRSAKGLCVVMQQIPAVWTAVDDVVNLVALLSVALVAALTSLEYLSCVRSRRREYGRGSCYEATDLGWCEVM